jgi:hypothetical protein
MNQLNFKTMKNIKRSLFICIALLIVEVASAQQNFRYIGADNCKTCHNKPEQGAQYDKWWDKDLHSQALESLSSEKAIEYGKQNGIANPATDDRCLKCHSTYHAAPENLRNGITANEGVSCEGCHGPGSSYRGPAVMRNRNIAVRQGLILQTEEVCLKCHNKECPFYKWFDFKRDFERVAHHDPTLEK